MTDKTKTPVIVYWILGFIVLLIIGVMSPDDSALSGDSKNDTAIRNLCVATGGSGCYGKMPKY